MALPLVVDSFCDFFIATVERHVHRSPYPVHGSKWPSSLGNPAPFISMETSVFTTSPNVTAVSLRARGRWGGAAATGGPRPTQIKPWQAGVLSWPGAFHQQPRSSSLCSLHLDSAHLLFWAERWSSWRPEVTAPGYVTEEPRSFLGFSWWQ